MGLGFVGREGVRLEPLRAVLAALLPLLAILVQWAFWPAIRPFAWFLFYPTVFLSSWIGGLRAGLFATALSTALVWWFFIPPAFSLQKAQLGSYLSALVFTGMGGLFSVMHGRLRSANREISRLYDKAMEVDAMKTRFFSNVSHELRTPLALIRGPVDRLLASPDLTGSQRTALEVVSRQSATLLDQVNALLDVARLEAGKMRLTYSEVDLSRLILRVAANFETLAAERFTALELDVEPAVTASVDAEKVAQVALNLLSNAFKFTPAGGRVTLRLFRRTDPRREGGAQRAVLVVADTGPGIPPELTTRIFERFFQVGESTTRRFGGTGLGLAIAKDLVELHGGRIWALNSPGGGAEFTVELPVAAPKGTRASPGDAENVRLPEGAPESRPVQARRQGAARPEAGPNGGAPRILVVEDNQDMREFIVGCLEPEFRVTEARNGREGLESALALPPDLILTDVMMPDMSGDELVNEVRGRPEFARVGLIVLSAMADESLRVRLLRRGVEDYLVKPFSVEELQARVRNLAYRKRAEEALAKSEASFRALLDLAPDAIVIVGEDGRIALASSQVQKVFGHAPAALVGQPVETLVPERLRDRHVTQRLAYMELPTCRPIGAGIDMTARRADGSEIPVEISLAPVIQEGGTLVMAIVRDVTQRKAAGEALARREADLKKARELALLKDHFLSTISHELKTPLSLIAGSAELLQDKYAAEPLVHDILDGTWRISAHLDDILDYSALVSGSLPLYRTLVSIAETAQDAAAIVAERFGAEGIRLRVEIPADLPPVEADSRRLTQMLLALLDNARKATPAGGTVTMSAAERAGKVELVVADTGKGIAETELEKIWLAFTQLDLGDAMRTGGLGLGLAIVKALADLHGGQVAVESEVGRGSRFTLTLPAAPAGGRR